MEDHNLDNIPNFSGTSEKIQKEASYDDRELYNLQKQDEELELELRDKEIVGEKQRLRKKIEEKVRKLKLYNLEDDRELYNLQKQDEELELELRDKEIVGEKQRLQKKIEEKVRKLKLYNLEDDQELIEVERKLKRNNKEWLLQEKFKEVEKQRLQDEVGPEKRLKLYKEKGENRSKPISLRKSKISVMMSYSWTQQSMVDQIRDAFLKQGLTMWMDKYDNYEPKGYLSGAIADAIEKAEIVFICISQDYEDSQYCKAEAEYAFQLKKNIIPLKMVDAYKATGWLGLLIAGKYYYNFSGKHPFREEMTKLITWFHRKFEINQRINQVPDTEDTVQNLQQPPPAHSVEVKKYEDYDWIRYETDLEDLE